MDQPTAPVIEALRPGTFRDMKGQEWTLTRDHLVEMAAGYDPAGSPSPVVIGHPKTDDPAFGWIAQAAVGNDDKLRLTLGDLDPAFCSAVEKKQYRKVSTALFTPDSPHNPKPGQWYIRHIGFLGAMPPAVTGLHPVQFAGGDEGVVEFASYLEGPWYSVGSIFRRLREWIISEKDLATADTVLPDWQVQMVEDAARPQPDSTDMGVSPGFAAAESTDTSGADAPGAAAGGGDPGTNPHTHPAERTSAAEGSVSGEPGASAPGQSGQSATPDNATEKSGVSPSGAPASATQEPIVTEQEAAQLREQNARLQAELASARQAVADQQRNERHADNVAFAAGLHKEGRLPTASQARIVAVLDAVGELETEVEFAAGYATVKEAPAVALREVLKTLPKAVPLGEAAGAEGEGAGGPAFAAPPGFTVDAAALELHNKALAYQKAHPDTDYLAAVSAVS